MLLKAIEDFTPACDGIAAGNACQTAFHIECTCLLGAVSYEWLPAYVIFVYCVLRQVGLYQVGLDAAVYITCIYTGLIAKTIIAQEDRMRRQAGLKKPPWTPADEEKMAPAASQVCRALCFSFVKQ